MVVVWHVGSQIKFPVHIDQYAKDLIKRLLIPNPAERLGDLSVRAIPLSCCGGVGSSLACGWHAIQCTEYLTCF